MSAAQDGVAGALADLDRAKRILVGIKTAQVRKLEHRQFFQALALTWFQSRRPGIVVASETGMLDAIDGPFRRILAASERASTKATYVGNVQAARESLISLRGELLSPKPNSVTTDIAPNFGTLTSDSAMQAILERRWDECSRCLGAGAPLAATVMMGGLLEALLVARANRLADKSPLFKAKSAPLDSKTRKVLDLRQWMLASYIDVAHELGWITKSAKDIAVILRDYRNYVHPEKERSHAVTLTTTDAQMFWEVAKMLARQLLATTPTAAGA